MKKFVLSLLLLSLIPVEQQSFAVQAQKEPRIPKGKEGKRPPPGWTPPEGKRPPPPEGGPSPKDGAEKRKPKKGGKKDGKKGKEKPRGKANERPKDKNQAPRISKWSPDIQPREVGDVIELSDSLTLSREIVDLNSNKMREPVFILFMNQTCDECKKGAGELAKLGKLTQDKPKIARADCTFDKEACNIFVNHIDASNGTYPFMILATSQRTHIYNGPINA